MIKNYVICEGIIQLLGSVCFSRNLRLDSIFILHQLFHDNSKIALKYRDRGIYLVTISAISRVDFDLFLMFLLVCIALISAVIPMEHLTGKNRRIIQLDIYSCAAM